VRKKEQDQLDEGKLAVESPEPPIETLPSTCSVNIRGWEDENEAPGLSDEFNTDQSPAAEQGNRVGDEMVSDDDSYQED